MAPRATRSKTSYRILTSMKVCTHYMPLTPNSPKDPQVPRELMWLTITGLLAVAACTSDPRDPGTLPPLPPTVVKPLPPAGEPRAPQHFTLTLVGEVRGEMDPCGCPTLPMGGFERRAGLLDELAFEGPPVFHFDAGNMLVEGYATGGRGDVSQRAELMLDLSERAGLDAFCPGAADLLVLSPEQLGRSFSDRGIAAVSSTWRDMDGEPLLPPAVVLERDGARIGVVGLSAQPRDSAWRDRIRFMDPVLAARDAVATLPDDLHLVVGLSNLGDDDNNRVASQVEELAAILSVRNDAHDEPRQREQGVVIEVPNRGRYLTVLRVRSAARPGRGLDLDAAERLDLDTYDRVSAKRLRLEAREEQLTDGESQKLGEHHARLEQQAAGRNLGYVQSYPLGTRYDGDPAIAEHIDHFKAQVMAGEVQAREAERKLPDGPPRYVSGARCFPCHTEQYSRWALTHHTQGYESLLPREEHSNPECLTCHTTGFAVVGGWAEIEPANVLAFKAVQCEACHGPGERHANNPEVPATIPTEATCVGCHDQDNSPDFDFDTYWPQVEHYEE